jgi:hypothetical protein
MENKVSALTGQDWTLFGLRWLILIIASLTVHFSALYYNEIIPSDAIVLALGVGALMNLVFLLLAFFPASQRILPLVVIVGDVLIAWMFAPLGNSTLFLVGFLGALIVSGVIYLGTIWGSLQAVTVLLGALVSLSMPFTPERFNALVTDLSIPLMLTALVGLTGLIWAYSADQRSGAEECPAARNHA